jgi:hypothetical protein
MDGVLTPQDRSGPRHSRSSAALLESARQGIEYPELLGEKRAEEQVGQYGKLADAGVKLSIAGDYPSSPMANNSMLYQVYTAITFKDPFNPEKLRPFQAHEGHRNVHGDRALGTSLGSSSPSG